jgi:putative SOS response-associated peptidase YedK
MCGRFVFTDPSRIRSLMPDAHIDDQIIMGFKPQYNIVPSQQILTMLNDGQRTVTYTRWGLIPFWAKDKAVGYKLINARAETLLEKPTFRSLAQKRRCMLFADGFYEWSRTKKKAPHYIHLKNNEPFAFAGLWDTGMDKERDEVIISSTIITTGANDVIMGIHDRMPVILQPDCYDLWLSQPQKEPEGILRCLHAYPSEAMETYVVSPLVNNPKNDTPECILPSIRKEKSG